MLQLLAHVCSAELLRVEMPALDMQALAQEVACYLGLELSRRQIKRFADGEIYVKVEVRAPAESAECRMPPMLAALVVIVRMLYWGLCTLLINRSQSAAAMFF